MPELPDVETFRKFFASKGLKQKIKDVEVRKTKVLDKISTAQFKKALIGQTFLSTHRHGKNLFAKLKNGFYLTMHFGMTGFLFDFTQENSFDRHSRILFRFDSKHTLCFVDTRMLGRAGITLSIEEYIEKKRLGPDALEITFAEFKTSFQGKGNIKSTFLDQHKIAGVGNIYADEILFQAKIAPTTHLSNLKESNLKTLYQQMKKILKKAIQIHANPKKMPASWIIPKRHVEEACPRCKSAIKMIRIDGRASYFCPKCAN